MIYDELIAETGFDPAAIDREELPLPDFELRPEQTCITCEEPSEELDYQDHCPACIENARFDRG